MKESLFAKMRAKERVNVDLKARYAIKAEGSAFLNCTITNLSSSGAGVRFPANGNLAQGTVIVLEIAIPGTVLRVSPQAEVMWIRPRGKDYMGGVRFAEMLSERMFQELIKKNT